MQLIIDEKTCLAKGQFGKNLAKFAMKVSGRKRWADGGYKFETIMYNVNLFMELWPECEVIDRRPKAPKVQVLGGGLLGRPVNRRPPFAMAKPQYAHQERGFGKLKDRKVAALFMGTGTGKTKFIIDKAVYHWCRDEIDAVLIFTKKGVHEQWIQEQCPDHIHESIPWAGLFYKGMNTQKEKRQFQRLLRFKGLQIYSINIDAVTTQGGIEVIEEFLDRHEGRVLGGVDESQIIKEQESRRHARMMFIKEKMSHRFIASGTPIAVNLMDEWSQFMFLDEDIIGHKYKATFRARYCRMGGFEGRQVVGHTNLEEFNLLVDPHIFRVTKEEELDLPDKVYRKDFFKLGAKQRKLYDEYKRDMIVRLDDGTVASTEHAAVLMMRLQQIGSGFIIDENGEMHKLENPRLERAIELDEDIGRGEKKIFWCRFQQDIDFLKEAFGSRAVIYDGRTSDADRRIAKEQFLRKGSGKDIFLSNPAAGGTGLNLQGECAHAIYYTNSYNAIDRWQSEDRIHRIGTYKTITYTDLIASSTVDGRVVQNLKSKKDFSTLVLDDIRKMMSDEEEYVIPDEMLEAAE